MEALFDETRLLFHAMREWVETVHRGCELSAGMRAVLEFLLRNGPTTVPDIARARLVSRQHIQQQVDPLLERKLAKRDENPAHKRSPFIALTDRGRALIVDMRTKELHALAELQTGVSDSAMHQASQVLAAWRVVLAEDAQRRGG